MILVIDNYDSFVYNIARYFECAGEVCAVVRNDAVTVEQARSMNPLAIVISPGPCTPKEAGVSIEIIQKLGPFIPVLGICLGHQAIGEGYGGRTVRAAPMHGKASAITHDGGGLFEGLPGTFNIGRYHSLVTELPDPSPLRVTARAEDGAIMAMRHIHHPVYGVQFHPESVLTEHGMEMIRNFVVIARAFQKNGAMAA
jgi:anthranilate synthase/aminodeoxychorismate synthase-like glutamine amidotransferase